MGKGRGNACFKPSPPRGEATAAKPAASSDEPVAAAPKTDIPANAKAIDTPAIVSAPEATSPAAALADPVPSTTAATKAESEASAPAAAPTDVQAPSEAPIISEKQVVTKRKTKVFIIFYSMYGHVYSMAQAMKKGVDAVPDCEAVLYQVAETLPADVLEKMKAPPKRDVPIITAAELEEADGFCFGFGTRFGAMPAQVKAFFDTTGQLWQRGALTGKPATFFTSTTTPAGGADLTIMTGITQLAGHGMLYVPVGYSYGPPMFDTEHVDGGSPWGAATLTTVTGTRTPSEKELGLAEHQGAYFAKVARKLHD